MVINQASLQDFSERYSRKVYLSKTYCTWPAYAALQA